jgi:uncharacterized lipoprotein YddW (UPF0748 family)
MNAAFLQVRPECDALYESSYEPWSRYLTGTQGVNPGYDPLAFAIEEAHKRGIELHAWLNPYRINANTNPGSGYYAAGHVFLEHPEWAIQYSNGGNILNPGLPEVQQYIKEVVGDLIQKYDLDGVHFDDYFYSYSGTPNALDQAAYDLYGGGLSRGDFRRKSVNKMIEYVWDTIQSVRPHIRFGVSPFGIYGNNMNPPGITGLDAYNQIYCDPLAWLAEGTVDYITPQLYWPTGGSQDYSILLPWWAGWTKQYDRHLFAGLGIYRLMANAPAGAESAGLQVIESESDLFELKKYFDFDKEKQGEMARTTSDPDPWTLGQINTQVEISRSNADNNSLGSVYFRMNDFYRVNGLINSLRNNVYQHVALPPTMTWKGEGAPVPPTNMAFNQLEGESFFRLTWDHPRDSLRFVVYAFDPVFGEDDVVKAENRVAITYSKSYRLSPDRIGQGFKVVVTTLDRYGYESAPSESFQAPFPVQVVLVSPANEANEVASGASLQWQPAQYASRYRIEVATDAGFTTGVHAFTQEENEAFLTDLGLSGESTFFWRVAGENISGTGEFSLSRSFTTAYPKIPVVTAPAHQSEGVSVEPTIVYTGSAGLQTMQIQISEGGTGFSLNSLVFDQQIAAGASGEHTLTTPLQALTTYYLRVRGGNSFGSSNWSTIVQFRTLFPTAPAPVVLAPANNAVGLALPVTFSWAPAEGATSYRAQIAADANFANLLFTPAIYGETQYVINGLENGKTYYARVASFNAGGVGEWSSTVAFSTELILGLQPERARITAYPNPHEGWVFLEGLNPGTNPKISLVDAMGRVYQAQGQEQGDGQWAIPISTTACQPCLLRVQTANEVHTIKLLSK